MPLVINEHGVVTDGFEVPYRIILNRRFWARVKMACVDQKYYFGFSFCSGNSMGGCLPSINVEGIVNKDHADWLSVANLLYQLNNCGYNRYQSKAYTREELNHDKLIRNIEIHLEKINIDIPIGVYSWKW